MQLIRQLISVAITLVVMTTDSNSQDGRVVHELKSSIEFNSEIDTLKSLLIENQSSEYDYLIQYVEKKKLYGEVERIGTILIKGDSIITRYRSRPTIVGDLFAPNPTISDSTSEGTYREKLEKNTRWLKGLKNLQGFYSQNTRVGNKEFYPRNWVRCLIIFDKSGFCFGLVKYGTADIDYQKVGKSESKTLKELVDFVF